MWRRAWQQPVCSERADENTPRCRYIYVSRQTPNKNLTHERENQQRRIAAGELSAGEMRFARIAT